MREKHPLLIFVVWQRSDAQRWEDERDVEDAEQVGGFLADLC